LPFGLPGNSPKGQNFLRSISAIAEEEYTELTGFTYRSEQNSWCHPFLGFNSLKIYSNDGHYRLPNQPVSMEASASGRKEALQKAQQRVEIRDWNGLTLELSKSNQL